MNSIRKCDFKLKKIIRAQLNSLKRLRLNRNLLEIFLIHSQLSQFLDRGGESPGHDEKLSHFQMFRFTASHQFTHYELHGNPNTCCTPHITHHISHIIFIISRNIKFREVKQRHRKHLLTLPHLLCTFCALFVYFVGQL